MKKNLMFAFLIFLCTIIRAQETIEIKFNNNSTGDYDLIIKKILNKNGYITKVNYGNTYQNSDLILSYETVSRLNYDELNKYKLVLSNYNGKQINSIEKTISYFNLGINEPKEICKGLSKLFNKKFNCESFSDSNKVKYFNITFNVQKIDSATYSIIAKGAGIRPLEDVEKAFLKKATQYLQSFDYYFESGKYKYFAPGGFVPMSYTGFVVRGIIKPPSSNEKINQMSNKPVEFTKKFE